MYVLILTIAGVHNLTQNVPNLTGYPNVPKIEQSKFFTCSGLKFLSLQGKIVIKTLCSILYILYCPFNQTFLPWGMNIAY